MTTLEEPRTAETSGQIMPVVHSHSTGPWKFEDAPGPDGEVCFQTIKDLAGHHVASTWGGPHLPNARVIAAAPEMLAALEKAVETIKAWHGDDGWDLYQHSPEMLAINSAMAKATGLVV